MTPPTVPTGESLRVDVSELHRLASAATPGPWRVSDGGMSYVVVAGRGQRVKPVTESWAENYKADAAYIAHVSPDVMLRLLERERRLTEALRDTTAVFHAMGWHDHHGWTADNCPIERCRQNRALLDPQP